MRQSGAEPTRQYKQNKKQPTRVRDAQMLDPDPRTPRDGANEREPDVDPRDVFMRDLDLPRGHERESVRARERDYRLYGSETRTLATIGAFRVIAEGDLRT